ncbi:Hypothetical protein GLP15_2299 [Giardia lamblia P15]|uniref:Uncharacterized protein n=1 Tax=Giardia intestinalis (strain P15) TaxID=658858 RepID=E1F154_GIAIA|nr:Hypothetical protein GLP15_2299 [Giardia lamblia P15]
MFSFGSKLYRFSEQSGELVLSWNDDSRGQWRAIHLPSVLRVQTLQDLCLARGDTSLFILSRPEQKVYHMHSDLSLSKKISFINMEAMSSRINSIAYTDRSYCIMGFTPDMHGYIIDGKKGGRFLSFRAAPGAALTETFPGRVVSVHLISLDNGTYAIIYYDQIACNLSQVDLENCVCTSLADHSFDYTTRLLYVFKANSHIVAICGSKSMASSNMGDHGESNSIASFTLSMSSSRVGGSLFAIVFSVTSSPAPVANQQSRAVSLLTDLPDIFRKECIYHNGSLVACDGNIIVYEPLSKLLSTSLYPTQTESSKLVRTRENVHPDSFSMNLSEASRNSDRNGHEDHASLDGLILRQSTGFGNNKEKHDVLRDAVPLTDEVRDAYEYLGIPIDDDHMSLGLVVKGLVGTIAKLQMMEIAAATETASLRKQVDELKRSLNEVKKSSEAQMSICQNFNDGLDDLIADRKSIHNTLAKIETSIAELAQQQLILASKHHKYSVSKTVGAASDCDGHSVPEKDLTTSDISATVATKKEVLGSTGVDMSTQTKRVAKTEKAKRSVSSPPKTNSTSYKEIEMVVQQTLRSLSPTRRIVQAPPQPMLYSMTPSTSLIDRTAQSNLELELLLLRDENEKLRKRSTFRSASTSSLPNYNSAVSPSSMAERLRFITKKMDSSMGRVRKIETALDAVDKSGHLAALNAIAE